MRNAALDMMRRRERDRNKEMPLDLDQSLSCQYPDALRRIEGREQVACVVHAMRRLPPRTSAAFLRHRLQQVPQKQIAQELGVSPTLVNFMIKDAERACRKALDEYDRA